MKQETVEACGADFQIRSLLDRQQYSDPDGEAERAGIPAASWSLFGVVWPSARLLAHRMLAIELQGQRILEVGCGLGLASLVLHRRSGNITASDCHPLVPEFLTHNLALNGLGAMSYQSANWGRTNAALGKFDLIIGSDVLYEHGHAEILSAFMNLHAEGDGKVVLVDPNRRHRVNFSREMEDNGFGLKSEVVEASPGLNEPYRGRVLTYRRG